MTKKRIASVLITAALCLTAVTGCRSSYSTGNEDINNAGTEESTEAKEEKIELLAAAGTVYAVKTAVILTSPAEGSSYTGFIKKGEQAELKGMDASGKWSLIATDGYTGYVLSTYLANGEGKTLSEGGAGDMMTGETVEVTVIPDEPETVIEELKETTPASVGSTTAAQTDKPATTQHAQAEKPTQASKPSQTTKPSKPAETQAQAQRPTEAPAPKPTEAPAPKPTEAPAPQPTEAPAPKPTEAPKPAYDPAYVVATATARVKAAGLSYIPDEINELLQSGQITQEEYNRFYPEGGAPYLELNTYLDDMESNIEEIVGYYLYASGAKGFYIEYAGPGNLNNYVYYCYAY